MKDTITLDFTTIGEVKEDQLSINIQTAHAYILCCWIERDLKGPVFEDMCSDIHNSNYQLETQQEIDINHAMAKFLASR